MANHYIDYTGRKVGKLTLIKKVGYDSGFNATWEYICDCGKSGVISIRNIKAVKHQSCGCNSKFNTNHRVKNHTLLKVFGAMHSRCYNPSNENYHNYGGRGIRVCDRWMLFDNFYDDMISTWKKGLWLDKINNNKDYCLENCRWVTPKESGRNTRNVKLSKEKAGEIRMSNMGSNELAEIFGVHPETIRKIRKNHIWV